MAYSIATSNLTSGFIDLATYDEQEKYMYGGGNSTAYFVREIAKSTWFTQVPVVLTKAAGQPAFNTEWSVQISRAGDYLIYTWLRLITPEITLISQNTNLRIRWTRNLMHNLIKEAAITFNDLTAARFDNYHLDFWAAFTVPAGKQNGYNNMIGNIADLIQPHAPGVALPAVVLNLPLPFFFSRDSGIALPTAALPYNDMRIVFSMRQWQDLLIVNDFTTPNVPGRAPTLAEIGGTEPILREAQVWANYAIVSNDERKRMACAPRDILMEQVQTAPLQTFNPITNPNPSYDIRFSHAVKAIFFAVRNTTTSSEWSNYTCASPICGPATVNFAPSGAVDPILDASLIYENTQRLYRLGADYYSLVNPYYHAPVIPNITGYHMYSYSLNFYNIDPQASTNYGKLTNVSIIPEASPGAVVGAAGTGPELSGLDFPQKYTFITTVQNNRLLTFQWGQKLNMVVNRRLPLGDKQCYRLVSCQC